jgi:hypothetical protein
MDYKFNPIIIGYSERNEANYVAQATEKIKLLDTAYKYVSKVFPKANKTDMHLTGFAEYLKHLLLEDYKGGSVSNIEKLAELYNIDFKHIIKLEYSFNKINAKLNKEGTGYELPDFNIYTKHQRQNTIVGHLLKLIDILENSKELNANRYAIAKALDNKLVVSNGKLTINAYNIITL